MEAYAFALQMKPPQSDFFPQICRCCMALGM